MSRLVLGPLPTCNILVPKLHAAVLASGSGTTVCSHVYFCSYFHFYFHFYFYFYFHFHFHCYCYCYCYFYLRAVI